MVDMPQTEPQKLLNFVKALHNQSISRSESLTFDKSFAKDGLVVCLYWTLIEYTGSFVTLVDKRQKTGSWSIFRSFLEAYVDFVNLDKDPNYFKHCFAKHHEQWAKALKASFGDNPYLAGIAAYKDRDKILKDHKSKLRRLTEEGFPPLSVYQRFLRAGMEDEYKSIYNFESREAHNDIGALFTRHFEIEDESFDLTFYKTVSLADFFVHLDSIAGLLLSATKKLHTRLRSGREAELKALEQQLDAARENETPTGSHSISIHRYRTHTCGALREGDIGEDVRLSGWCHRIRDHGGLLFIDLRDHYGLTQCVADPDSPAFKQAETLRVGMGGAHRRQGAQAARPAPKTPTCRPGRSRFSSPRSRCWARRRELPMPVFGEQEYPEDIRLKYRFLDLRRERLHRNIMLRGADHRFDPPPDEGAGASSNSRRRS